MTRDAVAKILKNCEERTYGHGYQEKILGVPAKLFGEVLHNALAMIQNDDCVREYIEGTREICATHRCEDCPAFQEGRCQFMPNAEDLSVQELLEIVWAWEANRDG